MLSANKGSNQGLAAPLRRKMDTSFLPTSHNSLGISELRSDLLSDFIQRSQPWSRERVPVPSRLRWALWALIPVELFWAIGWQPSSLEPPHAEDRSVRSPPSTITPQRY